MSFNKSPLVMWDKPVAKCGGGPNTKPGGTPLSIFWEIFNLSVCLFFLTHCFISHSLLMPVTRSAVPSQTRHVYTQIFTFILFYVVLLCVFNFPQTQVHDVYVGLSPLSLWNCLLWCTHRFIMTQPAAEKLTALLSSPHSHHTCCFGSTVPKSVGVLSKKCAHLLPVWMKWKVWIYQNCRPQIIRLYKHLFLRITKPLLLFGNGTAFPKSNHYYYSYR